VISHKNLWIELSILLRHRRVQAVLGVLLLLLLIGAPLLLIFGYLSVLLLVFKHRKFKAIVGILLLLLFLSTPLVILYSCILGEGMKLFYSYDVDEVRVVEDSNFHFEEKGYSAIYKLKSKYYLSHRILLMPESNSVPVDYKFEGEMFIEISDNNKQLLHSFKTDKPENILRITEYDYIDNYMAYAGNNYPHATSVFAVELGVIPFDIIRLKWSRLKNMEVKITVLKAEKGLQEFCDKATLVIVPDLKK
jgi:hypothetical protein